MKNYNIRINITFIIVTYMHAYKKCYEYYIKVATIVSCRENSNRSSSLYYENSKYQKK